MDSEGHRTQKRGFSFENQGIQGTTSRRRETMDYMATIYAKNSKHKKPTAEVQHGEASERVNRLE